MAELLLDSDIRVWVFLPIVLITFLVGIIRHYVTILLSSDKKTDIEQVKDRALRKLFENSPLWKVLLKVQGSKLTISLGGKYLPPSLNVGDKLLIPGGKNYLAHHALLRSRILRENGKFIPKHSFLVRKSFFNHENTGYLTKAKTDREAPVKNPMTDPSMMTDMLKGNVTNVLPMIIIGGWINWAFSGFLTTKVPFPLTFRFKPMLQRGVELISLDASWVSSASWYFLNVFGLRSMYTLILGQDNAADQTKAMQEQFSGAGMSGPQDPQKAFKAEWEALEICSHAWALDGVEEEVTGQVIPPETIYIKNKFA